MISLIVAAFAIRHQSISVSVDVKPSEEISGIRHFRVDVSSLDPITEVEFYVGTELRDTDSSVPYEFNLDTIDQKDGNLELTFAAYTNKGDSQKKVVDVVVNNGLTLGADAHVQKGIDFLHDSKWDAAILQARIALKISPENNPARMVMSRAYLGEGVLDKAEKYAQDWHQSAPADADASALLSDVELHRAFDTMSSGTDREKTLKNINDAFSAAITLRQQVLDQKLDKLGAPNDQNLIDYADTAIAARRYSLAISALKDAYGAHVDQSDITNRLAYAQLVSSDPIGAYQTLLQVKRLAKLDAYGNALMSVALYLNHDQNGSDTYMKNAVDQDSSDLGVRTAQAFIALRNGKIDVLSQLASDLSNDAGDRPETNYYLAQIANLRGNFDDGRQYFETMVLTDPLAEPGYLSEGNSALLFLVKGGKDDRDFRAESAQSIFQTALQVRPESSRALSGLALISMFMNQPDDAIKFATGAVTVAPNDPTALFVQSAAFSFNHQTTDAFRADRAAWNYDKAGLYGVAIPKPMEAWQYYAKNTVPVITPPK